MIGPSLVIMKGIGPYLSVSVHDHVSWEAAERGEPGEQGILFQMEPLIAESARKHGVADDAFSTRTRTRSRSSISTKA